MSGERVGTLRSVPTVDGSYLELTSVSLDIVFVFSSLNFDCFFYWYGK
jgi:hypothetical protein